MSAKATVTIGVKDGGPTQENFSISLHCLVSEQDGGAKEEARKLFAEIAARLSKTKKVGYTVDINPDYAYKVEMRF